MSKMSNYAIQEGKEETIDFVDDSGYELYLLELAVQNCAPVDEEELFYQSLVKEFDEINICGNNYVAAHVLLMYDEPLYRGMQVEWLFNNPQLIQVGSSWFDKFDIDQAIEELKTVKTADDLDSAQGAQYE